ncbi:hypothetical protein [Streptomyces griseoaurantiacus]|uniref:hypothetical protein n=1 Tax=Streptomyces griseoaurantiacus TaxID=68213 RepID=UPI00286806D5|nr:MULTISPECIES: hypothetical protein [Streptomyces]
MASTVYNQAALLASDVGIPDLARALCHRHAAAYLHAAPLPGATAIRALEPLVNLARLRIRAGQAEEARAAFQHLFEAVSTRSSAEIEGIAIPAELMATSEDREELRAWLWSVLLADGTRALTAANRWSEALAHVEAHRGIGRRMLDGRQVAVVTALVGRDFHRGDSLLTDSEPGELWETAVTGCLTALCRRASGQSWRRPLQILLTTYLDRPHGDGLAVFDTRLGLTTLDVIGIGDDPAARRVAAELHRRTVRAADGYAAREALQHPLFTAHTTEPEKRACRALLNACALRSGKLPRELHDQLVAVVNETDRIILRSLNVQSSGAASTTSF